MFTQTKALPKVLTFSEAKYYIFSAVFVGLAVFVPWLAHQFNVAGPKFVPMHFFVLISGLLFGWRTGIIVGAASPLLSYGITHFPPMIILPETMLELAVYGFAAGLIREKNFNIFVSLLGAMVLGRIVRIFWIFAFEQPADPLKFVQISWPGIVLQIALIPVIIYFLQKLFFVKNGKRI